MKDKKIIKLLLSIGASLFLIVSTTFVYLTKKNNLLSSLIFLQNQQKFYMQDLSSGILLKEAIPVSDSKGLENEPYIFKVVNNSDKEITYRILFKNNIDKVKRLNKDVLPNEYLRYIVKESNIEFIEPRNLNDDGIIYETTINAKSSTVFEFKMWLDYNSDNNAMNKSFIGKIMIEEVK